MIGLVKRLIPATIKQRVKAALAVLPTRLPIEPTCYFTAMTSHRLSTKAFIKMTEQLR